MIVDIKNMSAEQMKDRFMEVKIENLKNIKAKRQLNHAKLITTK